MIRFEGAITPSRCEDRNEASLDYRQLNESSGISKPVAAAAAWAMDCSS